MLTIGIDPGLTGAMAFIDHLGLRTIVDIPTMPIAEAGPKTTIKREVDVCALWDLLHRHVLPDDSPIAIVEHASSVGAMVGEQAKASLAATKAAIMTVLRLQGIELKRVHPTAWKRLYGLGSDKAECLRLARSLYPGAVLNLEKHHNRAEAALIARFGQREFA